jgi:hypothetical protein
MRAWGVFGVAVNRGCPRAQSKACERLVLELVMVQGLVMPWGAGPRKFNGPFMVQSLPEGFCAKGEDDAC